jgi:hypothetical protein
MGETGATGWESATRRDKGSHVTRIPHPVYPSRFSRQSRESRANDEIRFTRNVHSGDFTTNCHE